jgi:hypothetical protein
VKQRLQGLLGAMGQHAAKAGTLAPAVGHFLKVSRSSWPGLFHCYHVPDLPRTNNDLEQFFGAYRSHERRATGRKVASPAVVLRGAVRLVACAATRLRPFTSEELAPDTVSAWQEFRHALETRRQQRTQRRRFRRDPASYLGKREVQLLQVSLPPQFFFQPDLEMPEKEMGQHTRQHVMVPAWILPDFILVHPSLRFRFLEALFDRPSHATEPHEQA